MATLTGTYDLQDLLMLDGMTVNTFGLDRANAIIQADIARHNAIMADMIATIASNTTERLFPWGGTGSGGELEEVDEYARVAAQKSTQAVGTLGAPLRLFQRSVGWTQRYLKVRTPADLARQTQMIQSAHITTMQKHLQRVLYRKGNYTFRDYLIDQVDLPVKAFLNADSMSIPEGANGQTFNAATHTHYHAYNGFHATPLAAMEDNIIEHGKGRGLRLYINYADETAMRAVTGFVPFADPRYQQYAAGAVAAQNDPYFTEAPPNPYSRDIGFFRNTIVSIRPWTIAGYAVLGAFDESEKPIVLRERAPGSSGLSVVAENDAYPLLAQFMEAEFGLAVKNRDMVAVADFTNATPATYVDPL